MTEWASGNIYIRENLLQKRGDFVEAHKHNFDHTTYIIRGAVHVKALHPDGTLVEGDFDEGEWFLVRKDVEHLIVATRPNTIYHCIYSHRDPQGDVVQEQTGWKTAYE